MDRCALGDFGAERGVPALPAAARYMPAALRGLALREKRGGQLPAARNQRRIEPVVSHQREAEALEAPAQILRKIACWGGQRKHRESICGHGLHVL